MRHRGYRGTNAACAGTTPHPSSPPATSRGQPGRCGEQSFKFILQIPIKGPTPHARGPPRRRELQVRHVGTNPACGDHLFRDGGARPADQPRMRGDHAQNRVEEKSVVGPTQHARGPPGRELRFQEDGELFLLSFSDSDIMAFEWVAGPAGRQWSAEPLWPGVLLRRRTAVTCDVCVPRLILGSLSIRHDGSCRDGAGAMGGAMPDSAWRPPTVGPLQPG